MSEKVPNSNERNPNRRSILSALVGLGAGAAVGYGVASTQRAGVPADLPPMDLPPRQDDVPLMSPDEIAKENNLTRIPGSDIVAYQEKDYKDIEQLFESMKSGLIFDIKTGAWKIVDSKGVETIVIKELPQGTFQTIKVRTNDDRSVLSFVYLLPQTPGEIPSGATVQVFRNLKGDLMWSR